MRILQVSPFFEPHAGGVETHVRRLATELGRRGHEVTVLTSRYDRHLPEAETRPDFRIVRSRTLGVLWDTPIDTGTRRAVREIPTDVAHLHYPPPLTSWFATRGLRHRPTPVVLTYHADLYRAGPFGRLLTAVYEGLFLPPTLERAQRIIAHTRSYAETSAPLRARPVEIIPSAVDLDRFQPGPDSAGVRAQLGLEGKRVVLFAGRLVPHKGVDQILGALARLPKDVALIVVGKGPRLEGWRTMARRLGLAERVRFCPDVSDAALPGYFRAADVFVFPSHNRLEGFGLAVAEAMACGLPVIVADMPGVREVIEPGVEGLLTEPLLVPELAERLTELLADDERRRRMGAAARKRAEARYGVATVVDALLRTYESLSAAG